MLSLEDIHPALTAATRQSTDFLPVGDAKSLVHPT
jgi:hypothetical protein